MTRVPYFACDADIRRNPKLASLPNDSARYGWIAGVLGAAKLARPSGRFLSRAHFREALDRFARYLPEYLNLRLIEEAPDLCERCAKAFPDSPSGSLIVHDWHKHQRDPGSAERAEQWRANAQRTEDERSPNANRTTNDTDLSRAPLAVSLSTSQSSSSEGGPGETKPGDLIHLVEELTGRPWTFGAGNRTAETLSYDIRDFGASAVEAKLREAANGGQPHDAAVLIWDAHKRLNPMTGSQSAKPKAKGYGPSSAEVEAAFQTGEESDNAAVA